MSLDLVFSRGSRWLRADAAHPMICCLLAVFTYFADITPTTLLSPALLTVS